MTRAFIALGSNLDAPAQQVRAALAQLAQLAGCQLLRHSSLYRTTPVGYADQPDFINAVAELETVLDADALLAALMQVEQRFGRVRSFRNAPRVLDLDLLLFGDEARTGAHLTLPHPRMHERAFVMAPLAEIAPDCLLPGHGRAADIAAALGCDGIEQLPG